MPKLGSPQPHFFKLFTLKFLIVLFCPLWLTGQEVLDASAKTLPKVYQLNLEEDIMPAAWRKTRRALEEATTWGADAFLIVLNTPGGMVNMADSINHALLHAPFRTIVYIKNNAASAGALISLSCDSIYMNKDATIGAATVVHGTGEAAPDKYQSYFRKVMQSTAEAKGIKAITKDGKILYRNISSFEWLDTARLKINDSLILQMDARTKIVYNRDPKIAMAMVDQDVKIPGISDSGKVITFTAVEATKHGYCDGIVQGEAAALERAGLGKVNKRSFKPSLVDKLYGFISHPALRSILMLIMIGGIYFELQTPGVGFPIIAAGVAAVLYFAPLYLDGLAANWEILLFLVGLSLLVVELFVIPGFGVAGILGILLIILSLSLGMIYNEGLDFTFSPPGQMPKAFLWVVLTVSGAFVLMIILGDRLFKSKGALARIALGREQKREDGYTVDVLESKTELLGKEGMAVTDLRPSGKVEVNGIRYDALTEGSYILKGSSIIVVELRGNHVLVRPIEIQ